MVRKLDITEVTSDNGQKMRFEQTEGESNVHTFMWRDNRWNNGGTLTVGAFDDGLAKMRAAGYTVRQSVGKAF